MSDTYFRVYSGLLTPEHQERIGKAIWTYLWLLDRITDEPEHDGERSGRVLYGRPISYSYIGEELGLSKSTVRRQCESLLAAEYISMQITPRGNIFNVKRSKKWTGPDPNRAKNGTKGAENGTQEDVDRAINGTKRAGNGTLEFSDRAENGTKRAVFESDRAENDYSNIKDINNNIKDKEIKDKEQKEKVSAFDSFSSESLKQGILNEFIRLRGFGLQTSPADSRAADEIVKANMILSDAKQYMQECFNQYQPKHARDRINTLSYCVGYILDRHHQESSVMGQAAMDLSQEFLAELKKVVPDLTEPNIKTWASDMQKLLDKDKSPERIREVMTYTRNDVFWGGTIMTPADLDAKFDRLAALASKKAQSRKSNERRDELPKWLQEEKKAEQNQSQISTTHSDEGNKTFEEMLEELSARKKEKHQYS